jgi:hypothetical protein
MRTTHIPWETDFHSVELMCTFDHDGQSLTKVSNTEGMCLRTGTKKALLPKEKVRVRVRKEAVMNSPTMA